MRRVALRGLRARPLRTALTALAVVLGVAMIAGTYIFTDTINRSFTEVFAQANSGTDVAVTAGQGRRGLLRGPAAARRQPRARIAATDGVASAAGAVFGDVSIRKRDGDSIGNGSFVSSLQPRRSSSFASSAAARRGPRRRSASTSRPSTSRASSSATA